jgi:LysM repeat protein
MNPSLKKGHIPFSAQKISLTLPYAKAIQLASLFADTCFKNTIDKNYIALNNSARTNNETKTIIYKVRKGDLLADIAARFDISIREIKRWNKIRGNKLTAGKKLKLKVAIG